MRRLGGAIALGLIAIGGLTGGVSSERAQVDGPLPTVPMSDAIASPPSVASGRADNPPTLADTPPARFTALPVPDSPPEPEPEPTTATGAPDASTPSSRASETRSWTAIVKPGQTLDGLLREAGLDAGTRADIASAFASEYDVRKLRPGHRLSVVYDAEGEPEAVSLVIDDGVRIDVELAGQLIGRTVMPEVLAFDEARELSVAGSLYATLARADVPTSFAVELARLLRATIDVRKLRGGERLRILWSRDELENGAPVGRPSLSYAALDAAGDRFEIVRTGTTAAARTTLYVNGTASRSFIVPVEGGRLSSAFGPRKHPVYADMRLHAGVDFAAARGAPIAATAAGDVSFIGWRRGYGQVVELAHGADTMTRYAHLSAVAKGLAVGDRVSAGTLIGEVGETGTTTSPNLHYEVRVANRPVDPLGAVELGSDTSALSSAAALDATRSRFGNALERAGTELVAERS